MNHFGKYKSWLSRKIDSNGKIAFESLILDMLKIAQAKLIKNTIHQFLPDAKVLLFGSWIRGEETPDSDIDLLLVTEAQLTPRSKMEFEKKIRQQLTQTFVLPFDIIVQTKDDVKQKKELLGHIVYYAIKEGVEL